LTARHLYPTSLDKMDKSLAITICNSRNFAALFGFLKIDPSTELRWKSDSKLLLLRFLTFMDRIYKWTVCPKVQLTTENMQELVSETKFFTKLCEMNETASVGKKIHQATKKIITGTCSSLIQLVQELKKIRPFRYSTSQ